MLLPLFQGMSISDVFQLSERVPLDFRRQPKGYCYASQGEPCNSLRFVLGGELCVSYVSNESDFSVIEYLNGPLVVQPECLFGLVPKYNHTFLAQTTLHTLEVDKSFVRDVMFDFPVFKINYLNYVCSLSQVQTGKLLGIFGDTELYPRFLHFVLRHCLQHSGLKEIQISMVRLAELLLTTRLKVSKMLHSLENAGKLELNRERIVIFRIENLLL